QTALTAGEHDRFCDLDSEPILRIILDFLLLLGRSYSAGVYLDDRDHSVYEWFAVDGVGDYWRIPGKYLRRSKGQTTLRGRRDRPERDRMNPISCLVCGGSYGPSSLPGLLRCASCTYMTADVALSQQELEALYSSKYFAGEEYKDYVGERR